MKKQITKAVAVIVLLTSGFIAAANESEGEVSLTTEKQKAVVLKMDNIKVGTQISLFDDEGKVLFKDKAENNQYKKVFNLDLLEKGELMLEIENAETLEMLPIVVTETEAWLKPGEQEIIYKPIIKQNGHLMKVYFGNNSTKMKITVFDQHGSIAFRDSNKKGNVLKRYDTSKLQSGKYNIQFTADGRSFYHTITLD